MKKLLSLLLIFLFCSIFGYGTSMAAEPSKIKVGILLPLTGTFAAVAETQRDGALLAIDVINGGPLLREWVDDNAATPQDLDALATPDEQAWLSERQQHLSY